MPFGMEISGGSGIQKKLKKNPNPYLWLGKSNIFNTEKELFR
jgi:hypothetical protein